MCVAGSQLGLRQRLRESNELRGIDSEKGEGVVS